MGAISIPLLVISGPVGVGKTTVGNQVSTSLERRGVAHTFIDLDTLAETYPRLSDDRFGARLALLNLRDVWINCAAAGSRNLIVARVVETRDELEEIQHAVPGSRSMVCQLRASDEMLIKRVRTREVGSGRDRHEARALELAQSLQRSAPADFVVDTDDRSVLHIADEIVDQVEWDVRKRPYR